MIRVHASCDKCGAILAVRERGDKPGVWDVAETNCSNCERLDEERRAILLERERDEELRRLHPDPGGHPGSTDLPDSTFIDRDGASYAHLIG